ncbi:MAG: PAS domain-containing protein [Bacteroidota bacterium]|nr:PAS domain-containing protein [Bacteroidota bacterium]
MKTDNELKLNAILDNIPDMAWLKDEKSRFIHVNEAIAVMGGCSQEEFIGKTDLDFFPGDLAEIFIKGDKEVMESRQRKIFDEQIENTNGERIWIETIKTPIIDSNNNVIGTAGISRDITNRKHLEQQILNTIIITEEKERKRIAEDLHDFFGPLLSGIMLYVDEISSDNVTVTEKKKLKRYLKGIIHEAVGTIRTISNNIMPNVLNDWGLVDAIKSFCHKINLYNTIELNIDDNIGDKRYNSTIEIIIYRIIIELINNTIKHAKAGKIQIVLRDEDNLMRIRYMDDGKGFSLKKIINNPGMGLNNINNRLKSINGKILIVTERKEGVKINIDIPLNN